MFPFPIRALAKGAEAKVRDLRGIWKKEPSNRPDEIDVLALLLNTKAPSRGTY